MHDGDQQLFAAVSSTAGLLQLYAPGIVWLQVALSGTH
jgi:hypothetical protein